MDDIEWSNRMIGVHKIKRELIKAGIDGKSAMELAVALKRLKLAENKLNLFSYGVWSDIKSNYGQ